MKPKIAIVRGKFLNKYEMQFFEPLTKEFDITAFGSDTSYHDRFAFPVIKLPSPVDIVDFPYKMSVLNRFFVDAQYLFGLEEKLKGFDLVHTAETYFHYTQQCLNAKRKGYVKKVIATVLENIPHNNEGIWGRNTFKARARRELDHIIALTHKTKDALLVEGADPNKISVISHFVDTKRFRPSPKSRSKEITILFVGRLERYKGVFDVQEAVSFLKKDETLKKYVLHLLFVGNGSAQKKLTSQCVTARYDDMPEMYAKGDIFVAPSKPTATWDEQYCTALLEAQAAGLPIVTTRTGGIPENVGDAAVLVPPGDVAGLAYALKKFILDPDLRNKYSVRARKRAVDVHDIRMGANKISTLYTNILHTV